MFQSIDHCCRQVAWRITHRISPVQPHWPHNIDSVGAQLFAICVKMKLYPLGAGYVPVLTTFNYVHWSIIAVQYVRPLCVLPNSQPSLQGAGAPRCQYMLDCSAGPRPSLITMGSNKQLLCSAIFYSQERMEEHFPIEWNLMRLCNGQRKLDDFGVKSLLNELARFTQKFGRFLYTNAGGNTSSLHSLLWQYTSIATDALTV